MDALFDPDDPSTSRASDPETSRIAAANVDRAGDRGRALDALAEHGPMTDFELGDVIGRQQTSAGKRRGELVKAALAEWTGGYRPAPSGSPARVWRLTAAGLSAAHEGSRHARPTH